MKMILASNNRGKIQEMRELLADLNIEIVSQQDAGCLFEVDETGTTFEENSFIKAMAVSKATGNISLADDSGLVVDALDGAPGVYSARYSGSHADSDSYRCSFLLQKMNGVTNRKAKFICSITCIFPNGDIIRTHGECLGTIAYASAGSGGFGYDSIFIPDGYNCTMAQLSGDVKNRIGHRGKAMRRLKEELIKYYADK